MSPLGAHGGAPQRATGGTDAEVGLKTPEAQRRLHAVGPNQIADHRETPLWRLALAQFRSLVVLLLLAGAGIAAALGERAEAVAILAALLLNAAIGFISEWRARVSLAAATVPLNAPLPAVSSDMESYYQGILDGLFDRFTAGKAQEG